MHRKKLCTFEEVVCCCQSPKCFLPMWARIWDFKRNVNDFATGDLILKVCELYFQCDKLWSFFSPFWLVEMTLDRCVCEQFEPPLTSHLGGVITFGFCMTSSEKDTYKEGILKPGACHDVKRLFINDITTLRSISHKTIQSHMNVEANALKSYQRTDWIILRKLVLLEHLVNYKL